MPVTIGPLAGRLPLVVTVHDCFVLRTPEAFRRWMGTHQRLTLPRLVRRAAAIIASSDATRRDVVELLGVSPERVHVIPCGVGTSYRPFAEDDPRIRDVRDRYALPRRFVLTVGQLEPRKNVARLIQAVLAAAARPAANDMVLVHAGAPGWFADDVAEVMASAAAQRRVRFLGFVPEEDLPPLYAAADVLAYPSLGEGFGFPVAEAMATGTPVVTSAVTSMPEVAGDAALLVDPRSVDAIEEALLAAWTNEALRMRMRGAGIARSTRYRWDRVAETTAAVYSAVLTAATAR